MTSNNQRRHLTHQFLVRHALRRLEVRRHVRTNHARHKRLVPAGRVIIKAVLRHTLVLRQNIVAQALHNDGSLLIHNGPGVVDRRAALRRDLAQPTHAGLLRKNQVQRHRHVHIQHSLHQRVHRTSQTVLVTMLERLEVKVKADLANDVQRRTRKPKQHIHYGLVLGMRQSHVTIRRSLTGNLRILGDFARVAINFLTRNSLQLLHQLVSVTMHSGLKVLHDTRSKCRSNNLALTCMVLTVDRHKTVTQHAAQESTRVLRLGVLVRTRWAQNMKQGFRVSK